MSGRSGYVRVEQATRSQQSHPKPLNARNQADFLSPDLILSKFSCFSEYRPQSNLFYRNPSTNFYHDGHLYPKLKCSFALQSQINPKNLLSQVERSSFRVKMDEKCIKCRNKIRKVLGIREEQSTKLKTHQHTRDSQKFDVLYDHISSPAKEFLDNPSYFQQHCSLLSTAQIPALKVKLRRWFGYGRPGEPWEKLRKDPELFDLNGDTLIYLCEPKMGLPCSPPSFRISSHIIEATKSAILIRMLHEGSTENIAYERFQRNLSMHQETQLDGLISYQIYIPASLELSKADALRHQITTRNFFALLHNASLVGQTMYQALYDLRDRIEEYMPDSDAAGMIIDWIENRSISDPRYNPSSALSLLAWAEGDGVHWYEGWKEAFCHTTGMRALDLDKEFELLPEYRFLSPITKTLVDRFSIDTQILIQDCECRLDTFDFSDMWDVTDQRTSTARSAFDRFRKFLIQHYEEIYGKWPPRISQDDREQWLTRSVSKKLSLDFAALYDYLVNRTISWDGVEERAGRKWKMICAGNRSFDPDTKQLPLTDILISFDNQMRYPHIPHPYCLTPEPNKISPRKMTKKAQEDIMLERQAAIAYQNSTNVYLLGSELVTNDLVDSYIQFEQSDRLADHDPYNSRRGRWILIYGILQVLASISVDVPNLQFTHDVDYHLQCSLRGTPPWTGANKNQPEAEHTKSHCWIVPDRWQPLQPIIMSRHIDETSRARHMESKLEVISEYSETSQISSSELPSTNTSPGRTFHAPSDLSSPTSQGETEKRFTCDDFECNIFDSTLNIPQKCKDGIEPSIFPIREQMIEMAPSTSQNSFYDKQSMKSPPQRYNVPKVKAANISKYDIEIDEDKYFF
ncbi:hypothetical protein K3495_g4847 [Podosphaera aphanis]|nr:hypothetical protein K3495_g4847 [Podosphaera aphanis]